MAEETAAAAICKSKKEEHYDRKTQPKMDRFYHLEGDEVQALLWPTSLARCKAVLRGATAVPLLPQKMLHTETMCNVAEKLIPKCVRSCFAFLYTMAYHGIRRRNLRPLVRLDEER